MEQLKVTTLTILDECCIVNLRNLRDKGEDAGFQGGDANI